jgi:carbamoyl-phosphate synthase large subunit
MRGLRVIAPRPWNAQRFIEQKPSGLEVDARGFLDIFGCSPWPEIMVSEYLPGPEYTVDLFRGHGGCFALARMRRRIRSGITFDAEILVGSPLEDVSRRLAEHLDLRFAFGFQWKEAADGSPRILECNPRVQGTMVASTLAGVNLVWFAIREALGEGPTSAELARARALPVRFERFWGGGAAVDGRFIEI